MHEALLTLGFGLVTAAILSLSAVAFTLEYAVTRVANLSHGEILFPALAIPAVLYVIITYTKFGKALRAVSQNRELARVTGINARLVAAATWFLAGLVAGYAGFILAESVGTFNPYFGFSFFLITLTAAVAGGLGKPFSTLAGAIIVGIALEFTGGFISASYQLGSAFAILALVVLFRPPGLFHNAR